MTEAEARQTLFRHRRAEVLIEIIQSAWQAHVDERRHRSRRARASVVWDYMAQFADLHFAPIEGVRRVEVASDLPLYVCDEQMAIRLKKLDRELTPHNIPTLQQRRINQQLTLDGIPPLTYVSVGYVLDLAEADIDRVMAVKRVGGHREWAIDLRELALGELRPVAPVLPLNPPSEIDGQRPLPRIVPPAAEQDDEE